MVDVVAVRALSEEHFVIKTSFSMSSLQARLKNVDVKSKKIVIGFIRLSHMMIPIDIINLCILFYAICESFGKHGEYLHISDSENGVESVIVEQKERESGQTVLGSFVIDTQQLAKSVIEWTFKIYPTTIKQVPIFIMYIGIVDGSEETITNSIELDTYAFASGKSYRNYGWRCRVRRRSRRGKLGRNNVNDGIFQRSHTLKSDSISETDADASSFKIGDNEFNTVQLSFDITKQSLSIMVNAKANTGKKFENVDVNGLYRMALSMRAPGVKVEIVDFQITHQ